MKELFDDVSIKCSEITTKKYSTSFSLGIKFLHKDLHNPIYSIYGFVRFADEIVDSFHNYDKQYLFNKFKNDTYEALEQKISLNPILNSFQATVHQFNIDHDLIEKFIKSMEMDLNKLNYSTDQYKEYILGSAEVVGLMCLQVFVNGNNEEYKKLKPYAMKLGSAFQKVNFLRDLKADYELLGRIYFPEVDLKSFSKEEKLKIEKEIEAEFSEAVIGIRMLPTSSRAGVFLAYTYYKKLFRKIQKTEANQLMQKRIRIQNGKKFVLMFNSLLKHRLNSI